MVAVSLTVKASRADNHRELLTDTGIRVNWAVGVQQMIEHVLESTVLGACYWAGIDDQFYMPAIKDSDGHSSRHLGLHARLPVRTGTTAAVGGQRGER